MSPIAKPGRAVSTLDRISRGRTQHGDRFVMPYYGSGSGLTVRSLKRSLGTVTTLDRWALVDGDHIYSLFLAARRFNSCRMPSLEKISLMPSSV